MSYIRKFGKESKNSFITMVKDILNNRSVKEINEETIFFWEEKIIKEGYKKEFRKIFRGVKVVELQRLSK